MQSHWDILPQELKQLIQWKADELYAMERLEWSEGVRQSQFWKQENGRWTIGDWSLVNSLFAPCDYCEMYFEHYVNKVNEQGEIDKIEKLDNLIQFLPFDLISNRITTDKELIWVHPKCGIDHNIISKVKRRKMKDDGFWCRTCKNYHYPARDVGMLFGRMELFPEFVECFCRRYAFMLHRMMYYFDEQECTFLT